MNYRTTLFIAFLFLFVFVFSKQILADNNPINKKNTKVVVIDAGHGGKDSGALGKIGKEKDIVLSIALKLGSYIENNLSNVKVIYTRKDDSFIELHKRAQIANSNKADLFISIHVNSNRNTKPFGTETYAMGLHKTKGNLAVAQKENSVIMIEEDYSSKYEGFDPNSAESYIIFSLLQNVHLDKSLEFASHVQDQFEFKAKRHNRGVKQAGFLVLWKTTMPSVLIEAGFISNTKEEKYLLSDNGQDYIASAIYRALKDFLITPGNPNINKNNFIIDEIVKEDSLDPNNNIKISFSIQLASSSKHIELDSDFFKELKGIEEYKIDETYKYITAKSSDYRNTSDRLPLIREKFPDAFIVAFENNKKISVKEAVDKLQNKSSQK